MDDRTMEIPSLPSDHDPEPWEPTATDAAEQSRPADVLAEELFIRRLNRPSRRTLRLWRVLPPLVGLGLGLMVRTAAELVGVAPQIALALGATVLVSAWVFGVAMNPRQREEL